MAEVSELFEGWKDHPPTNILLRGLVEGLSGKAFGSEASEESEAFEVPKEALEAMQRSALGAIAAKAGPLLPILQGKDKGLPQSAPVFDLNTLREKNQDALKKRVKQARGVI